MELSSIPGRGARFITCRLAFAVLRHARGAQPRMATEGPDEDLPRRRRQPGGARKVARRILEGLDFEIAEAGDGMESPGLVSAARPCPTPSSLDWAMPVMDGLEFVRRLRAEPGGEAPWWCSAPARTSLERIAEALDGGADEYIMKPFDGDIIEAKFAQAGLL